MVNMKNLFEHEITLLYLCYEKGILAYNDNNLWKLFIYDIFNYNENIISNLNANLNEIQILPPYYRIIYDTSISTKHNYLILDVERYYYNSKIFEIPIVNLNTYELEFFLLDLTNYETLLDEDSFKVNFTNIDPILSIELNLLYVI